MFIWTNEVLKKIQRIRNPLYGNSFT